jgi:hypothetical protein
MVEAWQKARPRGAGDRGALLTKAELARESRRRTAGLICSLVGDGLRPLSR